MQYIIWDSVPPWWRHQMETFSALLVICAGNSPVPGEFPTQRPVTRSFDVYFDLRANKRLSKQSWGWWFETPSRPFIVMSEFCSLWILSRYTDRSWIIQVLLSQQNFHQNELIFWILFDGSIWHHHASQQTYCNCLNLNIAAEAK